MNATLDVVVVNWNAGTLLYDCLSSLSQCRQDHFLLSRVVVVDNASSDGSVDRLQGLDLPLAIIRNRANRGFAAACNQGAAVGNGEYLLFLNPDTRLYADSLEVPLGFLAREEASHIGVMGVQLLDDRHQVRRTCARFPSLGQFLAKALGLNQLVPGVFPHHFMVEWDHQSSRCVDQIMGAFFLVRRAAFEELAGFDERFFVYFEEVDFSLRARAHGWESYYCAEAQVYHKGGGLTAQVKAHRLFYSLRSRTLYAYKHWGVMPATVLLVVTALIEPITRLIKAALSGSKREFLETLRAYGLLWKNLPATIRLTMTP